MTDTKLVDLLPLIIEQASATLPEGCDSWGLKSVRPDLLTTHGFRWPHPGGSCSSDDNLDADNADACPNRVGDGLCVATSWKGMASGGIPALTLLLVAYASANVLGVDDFAGKLRVRGAVSVVALVDGERLVREHGAGADLTGARLYGAGLYGANLTGANLCGANLSRADLTRADLSGIDLSGAYLTRANLYGAGLYGANLYGADLTGANLCGANLTRAYLTRANLTGANLYGAGLYGANLYGANLTLPDGWKLTDSGIAVRS